MRGALRRALRAPVLPRLVAGVRLRRGFCVGASICTGGSCDPWSCAVCVDCAPAPADPSASNAAVLTDTSAVLVIVVLVIAVLVIAVLAIIVVPCLCLILSGITPPHNSNPRP